MTFWTRRLSGTVPVAAVMGLAVACGGDGGPPSSPTIDTRLTVDAVERVFVTRPFGGSLSAVIVYLDFEPDAPPSLTVQALGSDGRLYRGAYPDGAKICGFPGYLGAGPNPGNEDNRRIRAFIVPDSVHLTELRWRPAPDAEERVLPLGEGRFVCGP